MKPSPLPEHQKALARIRAREEAETLLLDRLVTELLSTRDCFSVSDLVDHRGLEDDGWTMHERGDDRIDHRRRSFAVVQRYLIAAVQRGELTKTVVAPTSEYGWQRAFYGRRARGE